MSPPEIDAKHAREPAAGSNMTVAHDLVAALKRHGVELMIGQSIPTALFLAGLDQGVRQVTIRVEKAAAMLADGYARISRKVPVVTALAGPGTPLVMAGMGEAFHASIPMLALLQDVPRAHRDKNFAQDFDDLGALTSVTKLVRRVDRADRIADYVDLAFVTAASGRPGPVALLLPPDLLSEASAAAQSRGAQYGTYPLDRTVADPAAVERAAEMILGARYPLIVAGGGVHSSDAVDALAWFQQQAAIPVGTTIMGKGAVADTHPLSLGVLGYVMGKRAPSHYQKPLVDRADLVLLIGTRTNQNGTNSWTIFGPSTRFIHLDIDPQE